jgi:hypothetical protein
VGYFGNSWIEADEVHERLYAEWVGFRQNVVEHIGGQTMNERLYWFGLSDRYDQCRDGKERDALYAKLLASP